MKPVIRRSRKGRRINYKVLVRAATISSIVLGVAFVLAFLFSQYTNNITAKIIDRLIERRSEGVYRINYDDIHYNFFDQVLTINNLYFSQDTMSTDNKLLFFKNEDNAFEAYVPYLYLNVKNIWSVYLKRELKITGIRMHQPDIKIISYKKNSGVEWQQDAGSLYDLVSDHLRVFKIDMLAVENGHFTFIKDVAPKRQYTVSDISFSIKNFLLDEEASENKEKFFYTDDIDVELQNQTFHLKDSIHTLSFKKLIFSTSLSEIKIDSLVIADKLKGDQKKTDVFNVYVPKIDIKNIDFTSAYNEGLLRIGNVLIYFPKINISDKPKEANKKTEEEKKNRISKLALDYFNNIRIDSFNLANADLGYVFKTAERTQGFTLDSFNVMLTNFILDSSNIQDDQRPIYYDDIEFSIKDYQFNLPDSIHILTFSLAKGSTKERLIKFDELRINPRKDINVPNLLRKSEKNKTYNIYLPTAELRRVGHNFLNSDTVKISELILTKPDIQVVEYPEIELDSINRDIDLKDPYPFISDLIAAAYLDKLVLNEGHFSLFRLQNRLVPVAIMEDLNLNLTDIRIDSSSKHLNKFLAARNMELRTGNIIFEDPKSHIFANTELLYYSSNIKTTRLFESEVVLDTFYTDTIVNSQKIKFHKGEISGLDINDLWKKQKKIFRKIHLENPVASLHFHASKNKNAKGEATLNGSFDDLEIKKLEIRNGKISVNMDDQQSFSARHISMNLENVKRDTSLSKNYSIGKYSFSAGDVRFNDKKENTRYTGETLSYDYDRAGLSMRNVDIVSGVTDKNSNHYTLKIPQCDISQWKPLDLYLKRELLSGNISIRNPKLSISQSFRPDAEYISPARLLGLFAEKVKADKISITKGTLDLKKQLKDDSLFFKSASFDIVVSKFDFDSLRKNLNFLFSEDISSSFIENQFVFQKTKDTLLIHAIHNSTYAKSLWFDGITYQNNTARDKSYSDLEIEKIYFKNIDYKKLEEKQLDVEDILILKPTVNINPQITGGNKNKVRDLLYLNNLKLDTSLLEKVRIGAIDLQSGFININLPDSIHEDELPLENLEIHFDNFILDEMPSKKVFRSDKAYVSFDGFSYNLSDDLNRFTTDQIIISFSDSALTLKKPHYFPAVDKYEYADIVGKQTDYLDIKSEDITLSGIDFFELFSQKSIDARKLDIDQLEINAFRDKRIPRENEPIKPLPQDLIKKIKYELNIDTAIVTNSSIRYEELELKALTPGVVDFTNLNATLTNISNVDSIIKIRPYLYMDASAFFMNGGTLQTNFRFDLQSVDREFSLRANLEEMDLTKFNKILEPNAFVKIKQGENEWLRMSAEGNENVALGTMIFEYDDLKISLISKNTYESKGMGPVLGSFFANTFIIKKSNPSILVTREGNIYFERNPYRSMFNYWAKIFFSGVVSSIGAKSNKKEIKKYEKMEEKLSEDE